MLPPLSPSSQEWESHPSLPWSFCGKRLPELGVTKEPPPALPQVRDGHSIPRSALLPGFYSPSRVSVCVC